MNLMGALDVPLVFEVIPAVILYCPGATYTVSPAATVLAAFWMVAQGCRAEPSAELLPPGAT